MNPASITEILTSLEEVATLMVRWGLRTQEWCLLARKIHEFRNRKSLFMVKSCC